MDEMIIMDANFIANQVVRLNDYSLLFCFPLLGKVPSSHLKSYLTVP